MDSWGGSHDDGEWIRPGQTGRTGSRRDPRPSDPHDDGYRDDRDPDEGRGDRTPPPNDDRVRPAGRDEYVRAVPREEPPPARRQGGYQEQHLQDPAAPGQDPSLQDTYDGYGYDDDYQHEQAYPQPGYADASYGRDATHGGGGASPFATGWLPLWPTIGIALAAVILAFIIGHVTAGGGGSNSVSSTVTTVASSTTTSAATTLTHTVARGETLSAIATQYGVTPTALATYNSITDPSHIFVGQVLNIPPKTP